MEGWSSCLISQEELTPLWRPCACLVKYKYQARRQSAASSLTREPRRRCRSERRRSSFPPFSLKQPGVARTDYVGRLSQSDRSAVSSRSATFPADVTRRRPPVFVLRAWQTHSCIVVAHCVALVFGSLSRPPRPAISPDVRDERQEQNAPRWVPVG